MDFSFDGPDDEWLPDSDHIEEEDEDEEDELPPVGNDNDTQRHTAWEPPVEISIAPDTKAGDVVLYYTQGIVPNFNNATKDCKDMAKKPALRWPLATPFYKVPIFNRRGYLKALLVQICGPKMEVPCDACRDGKGRFEECVRTEKDSLGACASCAWSTDNRRCNYHKHHRSGWYHKLPAPSSDVASSSGATVDLGADTSHLEQRLLDIARQRHGKNSDKNEAKDLIDRLRTATQMQTYTITDAHKFLKQYGEE